MIQGDVPLDLVEEANTELNESLKAPCIKHEEATGGYMLFAGDESGVVTAWLVLPSYFTLAPSEESELESPGPRASFARSEIVS